MFGLKKKTQGEPHMRGGEIIRDIVFGANDGLIAAFAVVSGVNAAVQTNKIVFIAGIAEMIGGTISMGLGAWLAAKSEHEYIESERDRELYEIDNLPDRERQEIRDIYSAKGFEGPQLEEIVKTICSDKQRWLDIMMKEELNLNVNQPKTPLKSALATGTAYAIGAAMPTFPYAFIPISHAFMVSIILTILTLFFVGAGKTYVTGRNWLKSGMEAVLVGVLAGSATYLIGKLVGNLIGI